MNLRVACLSRSMPLSSPIGPGLPRPLIGDQLRPHLGYINTTWLQLRQEDFVVTTDLAEFRLSVLLTLANPCYFISLL